MGSQLCLREAYTLAENLAKLFSLMDPSSPERVAFVSRALKWSGGGSGKLGHPRLHQLLALTLWRGRGSNRPHCCSPSGEGPKERCCFCVVHGTPVPGPQIPLGTSHCDRGS